MDKLSEKLNFAVKMMSLHYFEIQKQQLAIKQRSSLAKFIVTLIIKYNRDAHWCVSSPQKGSVEQSNRTKIKYVVLPRQDGITLPWKILFARFSHYKANN